MKIVLDSNVLIAAFVSKGLCAEILETCLEKHELVLSDFILKETGKKLVQKFGLAPDEVQEYLDILLLHGEAVKALVLPKPVCRDPDDDMILATALAGGAVHLVTGDKDLLVLKRYKKIAILNPRQAWERLFT